MLSIKEILVSLGIISDQINTKDQAVIIVLIISLAFISDFVCKKIALIFLHIHAKLTNRPQEEDPLKKKVIEKERVTLVRSFGRKGALPYGIHFDKKTGILTQGSESIKLTGQKLNLFILLLESRKTIVNHTTLYTQGMKHKLNPDLTEEQMIENISNAITRLRKELKTIPSIQIKSFRKKGYQLIFNEEEGAISVDINR